MKKMNTLKFLVLTAIAAGMGFGCSTAKDASVARNIASKKECDADKFVARVNKACGLSGNDQKRIRDDAKYCKQLQSKGNVLEIAILDKTGDLAVMDTKAYASDGRKCARNRFQMGTGVETLKVIDGYAYMVTEIGNLYVFSSYTQNLYEILTGKGNHYADTDPVVGLEGTTVNSGPAVKVQLKSGQSPIWDSARLNNPNSDQVRRVYADDVTGLSIFNDK